MTQRLDQAIAARGLARSRTHAQTLIAAGAVTVDGRTAIKPAEPVTEAAAIDVTESSHYVGRAAHKLIAGLDAFGIQVSGRLALDLGASTGGFTQVLRERGAQPVIAVDVGHGQLADVVAADPGVVAVEGYNVRHMTPASLAEASGIAARPHTITGDLSFISLRYVLPAVRGVAADEADVVLLIKPQFEAGRAAVRGGVVTDPSVRADAVAAVLDAAWSAGMGTCGLIASPIVGTHGNREYLAHFRARSGADPSQWMGTVNRLTGGS